MLSPRLILPVVLALLAAPVLSQQVLWMDQFGSTLDDALKTTTPDGFGGCLMAGTITGSAPEIWVAKTDGTGNLVWSTQFGTPSTDIVQATAQGPDGSAFVGGSTYGSFSGPGSNGQPDAWITRYDGAGNQLWIRQLGSPSSTESVACGDRDGLGGAYFCGVGSSALGGGYTGGAGPWIGRFDADGNTMWVRHIGGTLAGYASSAANDGAGGSFVAVHDSGGSWLARYDRNGTELMLVFLAGKDVQSISYRSNRLFLSWYDSTAGSTWLGRFDVLGNQIWSTQLSGIYSQVAVLSDGAGGTYFSRRTPGSSTTSSALGRFAGDGTMTWSTAVPGDVHSLCSDGAVGFYFGGEALGNVGGTSAGGRDLWWGRYGLYPCYVDADQDGFGSGAPSYSPTPCGAGFAANDLDCDDARSFVHPGAPELCDGLDNDCDGEVDEVFVQTYCTAGTSVHGCVPQIRGDGLPSSSLPSGFDLVVEQMPGQRAATIFYGFYPAGQAWAPFSTSYLCVALPVQRTGNLNTGGNAGQCNGTLILDFNAWRHSNPNALGAPFVAGQLVHAQSWYRDPAAPSQTNLSNALRFALCN